MGIILFYPFKKSLEAGGLQVEPIYYAHTATNQTSPSSISVPLSSANFLQLSSGSFRPQAQQVAQLIIHHVDFYLLPPHSGHH